MAKTCDQYGHVSGFMHTHVECSSTLWQCSISYIRGCEAIFEVEEGYRLATPTMPWTPSSMGLSFFQNLKSYLVVVINPDKPLAQPSVSALGVYINKRTLTHFRNGLSDWNYVCQTVVNTLKGFNVHVTVYVSNKPDVFM